MRGCEGTDVEVFVGVFGWVGEDGGDGRSDGQKRRGVESSVALVVEDGMVDGEGEAEKSEGEALGGKVSLQTYGGGEDLPNHRMAR